MPQKSSKICKTDLGGRQYQSHPAQIQPGSCTFLLQGGIPGGLSWMPSPQPPSYDMECDLFTYDEIQRAFRKTKSGSTQSPFDCIGYHIFKESPALMPALLDLFNACCMDTVYHPTAVEMGSDQATRQRVSSA